MAVRHIKVNAQKELVYSSIERESSRVKVTIGTSPGNMEFYSRVEHTGLWIQAEYTISDRRFRQGTTEANYTCTLYMIVSTRDEGQGIRVKARTSISS